MAGPEVTVHRQTGWECDPISPLQAGDAGPQLSRATSASRGAPGRLPRSGSMQPSRHPQQVDARQGPRERRGVAHGVEVHYTGIGGAASVEQPVRSTVAGCPVLVPGAVGRDKEWSSDKRLTTAMSIRAKS